MDIIVPIKQVPDLVEELEIDSSGKDLDREWLKFKLNEFDDHALEEALLMKEENGANVTVIALDSDDIEKALFAAAAKGADKVVKITGGFTQPVSSAVAAKAFAEAIKSLGGDVVMTGVQAVDDRDGNLGSLLAHELNIPHVSVVTGVSAEGSNLVVHKEFGGGVMAEYEVTGPVVLGIQAARETPRYVPVARIRRAQKTTTLDELNVDTVADDNATEVNKMYKPESSSRAEMLTGSADEIADRIVQLLKEKGIK
jgi:electron transfer flavoprotein beta subunit